MCSVLRYGTAIRTEVCYIRDRIHLPGPVIPHSQALVTFLRVRFAHCIECLGEVRVLVQVHIL